MASYPGSSFPCCKEGSKESTSGIASFVLFTFLPYNLLLVLPSRKLHMFTNRFCSSPQSRDCSAVQAALFSWISQLCTLPRKCPRSHPQSHAAQAMESVVADSPWWDAVWRSYLGDNSSMETLVNKTFFFLCLYMMQMKCQNWRCGKDKGVLWRHPATAVQTPRVTRRSDTVRPQEGRLDLPNVPGCKHDSSGPSGERRGLNTILECRENEMGAFLNASTGYIQFERHLF